MDQDQEVKEARAKLAARFGQTQIGGKGAYLKCVLATLPGNIFAFLSSLLKKWAGEDVEELQICQEWAQGAVGPVTVCWPFILIV